MICFSDKELWKIDPADKYKDFRRNRYFNTYKGRCSNCNQVGHPFRECPDPIKPIICSMCGGVGHNRFQCQLALCLQVNIIVPFLILGEISANFGFAKY